ncbi:sugar phosphate isomerase/epimerase [Erwinia sp. S63]|uniref:sugar phosphate isomerase/epimerase family protein n=1 Tax=Erwinia sp. S63 TaxID=2769341 RepID=UPI0019096E0B|nr:sugar phosphate isomerase/epimerase family protein [Erwinia sp. S63]MBK0095859.1 sugar phosphate isomerase/epimerase [Erwinia sp. S63]
MDKGIFSKTFATASVDENFRVMRSLGYTCTQFNFASADLPSLPDTVARSKIEEISAAVQTQDVRIAAVSATFNMVHPQQSVIDAGMASLDVICQAAADLNCPLVTLCTGTCDAEDQWRFHPDNNTPEAWQRLCVSMTQALEIAERYQVALGIEPELANIVSSAVKARQLIDEMRSERLKVIFDPANLFEIATLSEQHRIVAHGLDLLGAEIAIAHAKDRYADGAFATAGKGLLDYPFYLQRLSASGFNGSIVTHGLDASEAGWVSTMLDQQLQKLETYSC